MKHTVLIPTEVEIRAISISLPVRYDDEDMPYDFPFRDGDRWLITVDIDSGAIDNWPAGIEFDLYMKVTDEGIYELFGADGKPVALLEDACVPHGVIPGQYGDYVDLKIDRNGIITNWPKDPDVRQFFGDCD